MKLREPVPLAESHKLDDFDSGVAALDEWLKRRSRPNQVEGASRTYVVTDDELRVVGYYALASGALALVDAPGRLKRNMPDPIPMAILGRLAIDRTCQGQGLGVALLQDAVLRIRQAASIMGIRGILVHAISDEAKRFYEHHGFIAAPKQPTTLILSLAE
jgi:GNAT superfamily N-acetyltransferase